MVLSTALVRASRGALRNDRYERDMKIIPLPLPWPNVWWLCTFDLDLDEGMRRFGPCHYSDYHEYAWAFAFPCGLEVLVIHDRGVKKDRQWELQGNLPEPQHALEHLGLSSATVTWQADRVRRFESKTQTDPGKFEVWRLDDNGNEALVDVLASEATANCVVQTYEARLHKQTYFVREVSPHKVE